jgi:hypothetical protein
MSAPSPTIEGFRAAFRRPSFTFAEIAWRWSVGAVAAGLFFFYCVEYLNTLPVTGADAALLSTRQPALVGKAISHILRGSRNRAVLAALVIALALSFLWIIAGSIGRLTAIRALLDYFCTDNGRSSSTKNDDARSSRPVRGLIEISFLRVTTVLGVVLALLGAAVLSSFVSSHAHPKPGLAVALFLALAVLICFTGWALNWYLSLSSIFVVRNGGDGLWALSAAVSFSRDRVGSILAVSTWTGLAHIVAFSVATTAASLPLAFLRIVPIRMVILGILFVTVLYFAVVDWLYIARLAGYVCIAEMPENSLAMPALSPTLPGGNLVPVETTIDREEPILSDIPGLATDL